MDEKLEIKRHRLLALLKEYKKCAVAFSSGVDSTYLLYEAHSVLGDGCIAFTASSATFPKKERKESEDFCKKLGVRQIFLETDELSHEDYYSNPKDRCYYCKKIIFSRIKEAARKEGIDIICEGSNMDDMGDYRPGMRAIDELGIKSPLKEAGLYKEEIRALSKRARLSTFDKPSFACLASRIPYGERITHEKLSMVEAGEEYLSGLGLMQYRVRTHGDIARIEVLEEDVKIFFVPKVREKLCEYFHGIGYTYVTLDLDGFRSGSMNKGIK